MDSLEDKLLFAKVKQGDKRAFAEVVNRYSEVLFRYVYRRCSHYEDSQDIVQEVFASLWKRKTQIRIEDSLYPYLFKAAKYETIDWMVRKEKEIIRKAELTQSIDPSPSQSTEEQLLANELEKMILNEVKKMPKSMSKAFQLSRYEAKSIKEIAVELTLSEQTVKNNISLAISKLRVIFKP